MSTAPAAPMSMPKVPVTNPAPAMKGGALTGYPLKGGRRKSYKHRGGNGLTGTAVPAVLFLANHMLGKPLPSRGRSFRRHRKSHRRYSRRRR